MQFRRSIQRLTMYGFESLDCNLINKLSNKTLCHCLFRREQQCNFCAVLFDLAQATSAYPNPRPCERVWLRRIRCCRCNACLEKLIIRARIHTIRPSIFDLALHLIAKRHRRRHGHSQSACAPPSRGGCPLRQMRHLHVEQGAAPLAAVESR